MSSENEDMECEYQPDTSEDETTSSLPQALPSLSQAKYNVAYDNFQKWNMTKGTTPISESVLMKYFTEMAESSKPTTLWGIYSMLKATFRINDNIDITSWLKLRDFIKKQNSGYKPATAKLLTRTEIDKFINEAPDEKWLDLKVVCIFAINGVYGSRKFVNIKVEHVKQCDDMFLVSIPKSEASSAKTTFTITGTFFNIVRKYVALRPKNTNRNRFFVQLRDGKCTVQNIGINTFAGMPRRIAKFLKLSEVERYSGLSFRIKSGKLGAPTISDFVEQRNEYPFDYETINSETSSVIHAANFGVSVSSNRSDLNDVMLDHSSNQFPKIENMLSEDEDMEYRPDESEDEESSLSLPQALPSASQGRYRLVYDNFQKWNMVLGATPVSETILMKYFMELAEKNKPTTLFGTYSMLKATLRINDNIDISSYSALLKFLKQQNVGYTPVKSQLFTIEEIEKFINEAFDEDWLHYKVVCIFAVNGTYSPRRLTTVKVDHVKVYDDMILVTLPEAETSRPLTFTITGSFFHIVKTYAAEVRNLSTKDSRFFLQYRKGRCIGQNIGIHTFSGMARRIAKYLKLREPERYSALSFRVNLCKMNAPIDNMNLTSFTEGHSEHRIDQSIIPCTERSANYEKSHRKAPSVIYTAKQPVSIATNYYNRNEGEHVCTISCGQVKCAKEENEGSVLHAFTLMKPSDYNIAEVIPVQYASEPYCRWLVAYTHISETVSAFNADAIFKVITKSIPNNVRIDQRYISGNSSQHSAAYVVVYGVNCECQKESPDLFSFTVNEIKCEM